MENMFKLVKLHEMLGDATTPYRVEFLNGNPTIKEFIDYLADKQYCTEVWFDDQYCVINSSKIYNFNFVDDFGDMIINKIMAFGGWGRLAFFVESVV